MAFIKYRHPDVVADDPAARSPANILLIHGVHSGVMQLHIDLYRELMYGPSPLSRAQREMIATAVSSANGCRY